MFAQAWLVAIAWANFFRARQNRKWVSSRIGTSWLQLAPPVRLYSIPTSNKLDRQPQQQQFSTQS